MPRRAKPAPSGRSCRECIHACACVMQCGGNPIASGNATHCACYENLRGSNAYFLGVIAGRKEAMQEVVSCKDCEYSYDEISYLCCSHGVCADCEVPPNFYCAEGKKKGE